jgi:hypothetical protein
MDLFEAIYQIGADAMIISYLRTFADPHAVVDYATDVFGKLPVKQWRDQSKTFIRQDFDKRVSLWCGFAARNERGRQACHCGAPQELTTMHEMTLSNEPLW